MASELVRFNKATKEFGVSPQALSVLRSLTGPICVVAVCGRARQGKSFLLNQLVAMVGQGPDGPGAQPFEASGRFAVGNTVKPCTKGLWLWSRPVTRTLPNGQTCHLLLVDAEGIDSYDQTADYSNHIFSLALLLSSVLVYNQMGSIDESSVDKLASVCEFARLIWGRAEAGASGRGPSPGAGGGGGGERGGAGSESELARELSPSFVWLLRDFQLQLTEDGRKISERDYMEEVLRELPGDSEAVRAKNQLRASIKARFPDRECHALVRPLNDEAQLARMDALPPSQLRPEFRKGLDALAGLLLSRCRPKMLRGSPLTGPALAGLAEAYCRVINQGGVPAIASTWQSVVQSECRRALDAATDLYRARLDAARGREVGLEALEAAHSAALEAAEAAFSGQALGEAGEREPFLRRLREAAAAAVAPLRLTKRAEAEARAVERLSAEASRFAASVRGDDSDLAAAEARLHDFLREYGNDSALGPDKFMRAAEFLAGTVVPELRRLVQEARSRAAAASRQVSELEAKVAELTHGSVALRSSLDSASLAESRLGRELAAARAAADAAAAEVVVAREVADAAGREAAAAREQLAAARGELSTRSATADAVTMRLRSDLAAAQSRLLAAEAEVQAAGRVAVEAQQLAAREAEMAAAREAEVEGARRAVEAARVSETQARLRVEALSAQLSDREVTLANLQRERDLLQASLGQQRQQQQQQQQQAARQAPPPAAAAPAAEAPVPAAAAGERRAAAAAARHGSNGGRVGATTRGEGRKRNREAAELSSEASDDVDVEMIDAGPSRFAAGSGSGAAAAAAAAGGGGAEESDDGVQVLDQETAAAAAADRPIRNGQAAAGTAAGATTPGLRQPRRRQPNVAEPASGQRGRAGAAMPTPAAAAAAATPPARAGGEAAVGGSAATERAPFSVEREVLRTTRRGAAAATTTTPPPAAAAATMPPPAAAAAAGGGAAVGGGALERGSPFSVEREVLRTTPRRGSPGARQGRGAEAVTTATAATDAAVPAPAAAAAAAAAPRPELPADLDSMKVDDMKAWLTQHGWEEEVFARSRGRTTKREWADMVRSKCAPSAGGGREGGGGGGPPSPSTGGRRQARR